MFDTTSIPAVEITLWSLVGFSVATWSLIVVKGLQHAKARRANRRYAEAFWATPNLQAAAGVAQGDAPLPQLARAGFAALRDNPEAQDLEHSWDRQDLLERQLRQQIIRERRGLESGLAVLASIGSTAPFVGLFGTVWGIMNALTDIGRLGSASLEVVAAPIGEALVATGIGIAVAVPAVLAYNFFVRRVKSITAELDDFAHDFLNLAQRAAFRVAPSSAASAAARAASTNEAYA